MKLSRALIGATVVALMFTWLPPSASPVSTPAPASSSTAASPATSSPAIGQASTSPAGTAQQKAPVTITLNSMTPRSPAALKLSQVVTFTATLTNTGDTTYSDVAVQLQRGLPIGQQNLLDAAIATPPETGFAPQPPVDQNKVLKPHSSISMVYRITTEQMCLCFDGVYPYALVASAQTDPSGSFEEVGRLQVLVPSFIHAPQPVTVSWVWPLIDRPHRSTDERIFLDNDLAGSISAGGRLDRALRTAELVAGKINLTILVDPDLLDALAVMASPEGYKVRTVAGTVKGTDGPLAAQWLARLNALETRHEVVLTAFADPDVDAAIRAGLTWSTALEPQVQNRISTTVNGNLTSDLSWPVSGVLTSKALDATIGGGASTVVLSDAALSGQNKTEPRPDALSPLPSANGEATALVTDSAIERTIGQILKLGANPANDQQTLLAQLAIRAAQDPSHSHYVVMTPYRYVDTSPQVAADTMLSVIGTGWSQPISVRQALNTVKPVDRGPLQTSAANAADELDAGRMQSLIAVRDKVGSLREALDSAAAAPLLGGFSGGMQRAQSTAYRLNPAVQVAVIAGMTAQIDKLLGSVHLVQPSDGTYSLSSANSPVVVTVANDLQANVRVRIAVDATNGAIGFRAPAIEQTVPALSRKTISVPTRADRLGKFQVQATLSTPDGMQLGASVHMNLRATALGGITKTITFVAAAVLVLALFRRLVRRLRHRRAPGGVAVGVSG